MTIDIAQSGFYALTSATTAIRAEYAGVRTAINAEATVDLAYMCPELLDELVAATHWPNPPSSSAAWVDRQTLARAPVRTTAAPIPRAEIGRV